jgi:hypothetical protein
MPAEIGLVSQLKTVLHGKTVKDRNAAAPRGRIRESLVNAEAA